MKFLTWPGATSGKNRRTISPIACPLLVSEIVALVLSVTSAMALPFLIILLNASLSYRNRNGGGATPPSSPSLMAFQLFPSSSLRNTPALVPA